jgi:type II secretory ATPase GspE/PulE/Tfp pilus assembly ATPase PilB-like protein
MGVEPYLVSSTLEMVAAQRLVRLICKHCKAETSKDEVDKLRQQYGDVVPEMLYRGTGCRNCQGSGYRGRQGVFEMMPVTDEIRTLILAHSSSRDIRKVAVKQGMVSLRDDGWRLIREGKTTPEEVLRMTKDEDVATGSAELMASRP